MVSIPTQPENQARLNLYLTEPENQARTDASLNRGLEVTGSVT